MLLKELSPGARGRIVALRNRSVKRSARPRGATPGAEFEVVRIAPLGDPVEIRVRGSMISVRRDEAAIMEVSVD